MRDLLRNTWLYHGSSNFQTKCEVKGHRYLVYLTYLMYLTFMYIYLNIDNPVFWWLFVVFAMFLKIRAIFSPGHRTLVGIPATCYPSTSTNLTFATWCDFLPSYMSIMTSMPIVTSWRRHMPIVTLWLRHESMLVILITPPVLTIIAFMIYVIVLLL